MIRDFEQYGRRLRRFGTLTIFSVYFLIFIGGLVRGTGSGMGCPDWPKCFGQWVPPTDVSQLPPDYKEKYKDHGYASMDFNVLRTWTEYLNRLAGVLIGFFIFLTLLFSVAYLKTDRAIFWLNFLAFVLVGLQGWIGAKVVDSNLAHWMVSIHMLLALVIVGLLIYSITRSQQFVIGTSGSAKSLSSLKVLSMIVLLLALGQVVGGTQVREAVDVFAKDGSFQRSLWLQQMGTVFTAHKTMALLLLVANALLVRNIYASFAGSLLNKAAVWLMLSLGLQLIGGLLLEKMALPPVLQMFHLFIGSISIGIQLFISILLFTKTRQIAALV